MATRIRDTATRERDTPVLRAADLLPQAVLGPRSRPVRAVLSILGVAIGIAAIVAVLGITRSSQSDLLARIDRLGTNLLTVAVGQSLTGERVELPTAAPRTIARTSGVRHVAPTAELPGLSVYRSDRIPSYRGSGLAARAVDPALLSTLDARLAAGVFLSAATAGYPATVLGHDAAQQLGITGPGGRIYLGGHWFVVVGVLRPVELAPEIDHAALIGFPVAARLFRYDDHPSLIYVRTDTERTAAVADLLAPAATPEHPEAVSIGRPSDALTARLAVADSTTSLYLGLGAVALLVGGIGIANTMVISVIERRGEIGLRRALGAARRHIAAQFLTESLILAAFGALAGITLGLAITTTVARLHDWTVGVPPVALWGALLAAVLIGALAGLDPAIRAARLAPAEALRSE